MAREQWITRKAVSLSAITALGAVALVFATITRGGDVPGSTPKPGAPPAASDPHRSPIALAVFADGSRLLVANQTAGSVSLVDPKAGKVLHEIKTGDKPAGVAISRDGRRGAVTHWYGYDLAILDVKDDHLALAGRIEVGPEPRGVAMTADGSTAFVAVGVTNEVARVDLNARKVTGQLAVGREPRSIAISPDGSRLLVSNARGQGVTLVDTGPFKVVCTIPIDGDNLRQVTITVDGKTGYVANMRNRGMATTRNNIDLGWVLGQRLTRVPLDGTVAYSTLTLDKQGKAASDAHGVAVSRDERFVAVSCGGTHELMIFRTDLKPLPWRENRRVDLGGRPTELAFAPDGAILYVANYLADAVQVVDAESGSLVKTISLGAPKEISLARRGEILFHDAKFSHNQWYSCNTCHSDGHTNGLDFDTLNDGRQDLSTFHLRSRKKVPSLRRATKTKPWTWHGWQTELSDAMVESITKSMQGPKPKSDDVKALVAYLDTLDFPANPYREPGGKLSLSAERGRAVYRSAKAACSTCHGGLELTDGKVHMVGLEEPDDAYKGYNPPSLRGIYDKDPYLHDGRAKSLREVLTGPHEPDAVAHRGELSAQELDDLIAYLKTL
jgi:YVTN family beta-propeller protein